MAVIAAVVVHAVGSAVGCLVDLPPLTTYGIAHSSRCVIGGGYIYSGRNAQFSWARLKAAPADDDVGDAVGCRLRC